MHFAEATQGNAGDVQLCIWQLMAAYCLPPRKRRRHRLEGDLDYLAATQYCHSALSTIAAGDGEKRSLTEIDGDIRGETLLR
eukprot:IDg15603t1